MDRDPPRRYPRRPTSPTTSSGSSTAGRPGGRRLSVIERMARWARRSPAVAGLLAAVAITLLAATAVSNCIPVPRCARTPGRYCHPNGRLARPRPATCPPRTRPGDSPRCCCWTVAWPLPPPGSCRGSAPDARQPYGPRATLSCTPGPHPPGQLVRPHSYVLLLDRHTSPGSGPQPRWPLAPSRPAPTGPFRDSTIPAPEEGLPDGEPASTSHQGIAALSFSPDGKTLLAASGSEQETQYRPGWASRWDMASRRFLGRSLGHRSTVEVAAWFPTASGSSPPPGTGTLLVWMRPGKQSAAPHVGLMGPAAFSPDGETVVIASRKAVRLVEIATGRSRRCPSRLQRPNADPWPSTPTHTAPGGRRQGGLGMSAPLCRSGPRRPAAKPRPAHSDSARLSFLGDGRAVGIPSGQVSADGASRPPTRRYPGVAVPRPVAASRVT